MQYEETINEMITEIERTLARIDTRSINVAIEYLTAAERLFITGAGRSGLVMRSLAIRLMHLGKQVFVIGETNTPRIGAGDLLVIGSGSGRTDSLVVYAKKAKSVGARLLLFTISPNSPIGELSDQVVVISAASHKVPVKTESYTSLQPKGSLFEQALFLFNDYLVIELMKRADLSSEDLFLRHANLE
jgi:6-phospho-3-hexuloisomerase